MLGDVICFVVPRGMVLFCLTFGVLFIWLLASCGLWSFNPFRTRPDFPILNSLKSSFKRVKHHRCHILLTKEQRPRVRGRSKYFGFLARIVVGIVLPSIDELRLLHCTWESGESRATLILFETRDRTCEKFAVSTRWQVSRAKEFGMRTTDIQCNSCR